MENNYRLPENNYHTEKVSYIDQPRTRTIAKSFMANVFLLMGCALAVSGIVAYLFSSNDALRGLLYVPAPNGTLHPSMLAYIAIFSPLVFVLIMGYGINRLSVLAMGALFGLLSILMGMSLSFIFLVYTDASIYTCFFSAAGMFGVMAFMGYTTNKDLTNFGSLLYMALFGVIIASLINFFLHSEQMGYIIGVISILIFTGITAYKVQWIKQMGEGADMADASSAKLAIYGAMSLYITFINLFLSLLRVFGGRRR